MAKSKVQPDQIKPAVAEAAPPPAHNDYVSAAATRDDQVVADARHDFLSQLTAIRNAPVKAYVPPPMTDKQKEKRAAEMAGGAARSKFFADQAAQAKKPVAPAPADGQGRTDNPRRPMNPIKEGTNTEVFRPQDYTHEARNKEARTIREG